MKTEIIENMDFAEYLKIDRLSSSDLMKISKDPALYHYSKVFGQTKTSSLNFGRKLHLALLEEEKFLKLEVAKTATTIKEGFIGRLEYQYIIEIKRIVKLNPRLNSIFKKSKTEQTILWNYDDIKLKSRLDLVKLSNNNTAAIILDIKSTCCDNTRDIERAAREYNYEIQAQTYIKALKSVYTDLKEVFFLFVFCTKQPPFQVHVEEIQVYFDDNSNFDHEFKNAIEIYKNLPSIEDLSKSRVKFFTQGDRYATYY